jgi:hypothetical protein
MPNNDNPLIADLVSLTLKGEAVVSLMKLRRLLSDLSPGDRAEVRTMMAEMVDESERAA